MGRRALPLPMDVRDLDQIARRGRRDRGGTSAGSTSSSTTPASGPANPAEDVTEADFDLTFDVNVKGSFFASQAAGRVMIRQGSGRIVNLSSQAGFVALPAESVYCIIQGGRRRT